MRRADLVPPLMSILISQPGGRTALSGTSCHSAVGAKLGREGLAPAGGVALPGGATSVTSVTSTFHKVLSRDTTTPRVEVHPSTGRQSRGGCPTPICMRVTGDTGDTGDRRKFDNVFSALDVTSSISPYW